MKTTTICYVRMSDGTRKKYKCIDGLNFKDKKGNSYNAPVMDKKEIMESKHWLAGTKRIAWYREGQPNAIPLDRDAKWTPNTNSDDKDVLIFVTKQALMEANLADLKANATLGGLGGLALLIILHMLTS